MDLAVTSRLAGRLAAIGSTLMDLEDRLLVIEMRLDALEAKKKNTRFVKPTVSQVADYMRTYCLIQSIQTNADPQQFVDFYESKGWKVGKTTMKNWEASCRGWINRDKSDKKDYVADLARRVAKTKWVAPENPVHSLFGDE